MNINPIKLSGVKPMLNTFFVDTKVVMKDTLERKVEIETIRDALEANLIRTVQSKDGTYCYKITPIGIAYRDE